LIKYQNSYPDNSVDGKAQSFFNSDPHGRQRVSTFQPVFPDKSDPKVFVWKLSDFLIEILFLDLKTVSVISEKDGCPEN
jgi:hypothetical protein